MKKTLILLALIIFVSCSKEDISEPVSNCGEIRFLESGQPTPSCQTGYSVTWITGNIANVECITEQRFNDLEVGGQFCGTINN